MTQNQLKYLSKLLLKKFRSESNLFLIEGKKNTAEALYSNAQIKTIFIDKNSVSSYHDIIEVAQNKEIEIDYIQQSELNKICDSKTPQGIAALLHKPQNALSQTNLIVAVENIQDPGNVGTIIRTCDWFDIKQVILSDDSVDLYNPKLIRSTMGSIFHINVFESASFYDDLISLNRKGYKLICADLNGTDIKEKVIPKKTVLIFCNESKGPSEKLLSLDLEMITIKKFGNAESLNVANAAAIILSEFAYRRK